MAGEAWIDDSLGAILRKLKELGIDDNTLVIFAPDHGRDGKASVFSHASCQVPMIMRWPKGIPPGRSVKNSCRISISCRRSSILGKAEKPKFLPNRWTESHAALQNGTAEDWRDHLYLEMGAARATVTKDWSYIAVRYTKEQIAAIKRAAARKTYREPWPTLDVLGIGVRGADRPGFFDEDQLYNLKSDPKEMKNLAYNEGSCKATFKRCGISCIRTSKSIGRPFGEFIPGGNATEPGQIDKQIENR